MYSSQSIYPSLLREPTPIIKPINELMAIKTKPGIIRLLPINHIVAVKAAGNYVELYLKAETLLHRSTLKALLGELPESFLQVHRSYIVNLTHLCEIHSELGRYSECYMSNGQIVPLSSSCRHRILTMLGVCDDD